MNVLLLHLDAPAAAAMAQQLEDDGHSLTLACDTAAALAARPPSPHVLVVCLDAQPQRTLDLAARLGAGTEVPTQQILFVGGSSASLGEAQRRFPKASFARLDSLSTSLASMEAP